MSDSGPKIITKKCFLKINKVPAQCWNLKQTHCTVKYLFIFGSLETYKQFFV
jgi:hypothetical protein